MTLRVVIVICLALLSTIAVEGDGNVVEGFREKLRETPPSRQFFYGAGNEKNDMNQSYDNNLTKHDKNEALLHFPTFLIEESAFGVSASVPSSRLSVPTDLTTDRNKYLMKESVFGVHEGGNVNLDEPTGTPTPSASPTTSPSSTPSPELSPTPTPTQKPTVLPPLASPLTMKYIVDSGVLFKINFNLEESIAGLGNRPIYLGKYVEGSWSTTTVMKTSNDIPGKWIHSNAGDSGNPSKMLIAIGSVLFTYDEKNGTLLDASTKATVATVERLFNGGLSWETVASGECFRISFQMSTSLGKVEKDMKGRARCAYPTGEKEKRTCKWAFTTLDSGLIGSSTEDLSGLEAGPNINRRISIYGVVLSYDETTATLRIIDTTTIKNNGIVAAYVTTCSKKTGTIIGTVTSLVDRSVVDGAVMSVYPIDPLSPSGRQSSDFIARTQSGANGTFIIPNVPIGTYVIIASDLSNLYLTQKLSNIIMNDVQTSNFDIALRHSCPRAEVAAKLENQTIRYYKGVCSSLVRCPQQEEGFQCWTYGTGEWGVEKWGEVSTTCESGTAQSPMNIITKSVIVDHRAYGLEYNYPKMTKTNMIATDREIKLIIMDDPNENTLKHSRSLLLNNVRSFKTWQYELNRVSFYVPAEHMINHKEDSMEIAFEHSNNANLMSIVSVLVREGEFNQEIDDVITAATSSLSKNSPIPISLHLEALLPPGGYRDQFFTYEGSMSRPPCSEPVRRHIITEYLTASKKQIENFKKLILIQGTARDGNARSLQPSTNRPVHFFPGAECMTGDCAKKIIESLATNNSN